jgi:hypothetical protein
MKPKKMAAESAADSPDGWTVVCPDFYHFAVGVEPPRPGSFLRTLKSSAGDPTDRLLWALGIGLFTGGVVALYVGVGLSWLWLALLALGLGLLVLVVALAGRLWRVLAGVCIGGVVAVWVIFGVVGESGRPWVAVPALVATFFGARALTAIVWMFYGAVRNLRRGPVLRGEIHSLGPPSGCPGLSTADARLPDGRSIRLAVKADPVSAFLDRNGAAEILILANPDERQGCVIGIRPLARDRSEGREPQEGGKRNGQ